MDLTKTNKQTKQAGCVPQAVPGSGAFNLLTAASALQGEKEHPADTIYIREVTEAEVKPKARQPAA